MSEQPPSLLLQAPEMRMSELEASPVLPLPARCVPRQAWRNGITLFGERTLAEEVPVAFSYDGATHAVLMATPDDFEDFALGLLRTGCSAGDGIIVLSSRISIELVQKAGMMEAAIIVGVSAPTALAVRIAEMVGLTLVGIARDDKFEVFTHPEWITRYW
jgi:formate dehydrogenase assembly factor FdhD